MCDFYKMMNLFFTTLATSSLIISTLMLIAIPIFIVISMIFNIDVNINDILRYLLLLIISILFYIIFKKEADNKFEDLT